MFNLRDLIYSQSSQNANAFSGGPAEGDNDDYFLPQHQFQGSSGLGDVTFSQLTTDRSRLSQQSYYGFGIEDGDDSNALYGLGDAAYQPNTASATENPKRKR